MAIARRFLMALAGGLTGSVVLALSGCAGEEITWAEAIQYACHNSGVTDYDYDQVVIFEQEIILPELPEPYREFSKSVIEARVSGGNIHDIVRQYSPDEDTLTWTGERIWIENIDEPGGTTYSRETTASSPYRWGEWEIEASTGYVTFPGLCLDDGSEEPERVGRHHYALQTDDAKVDLWIDEKGFPERIVIELVSEDPEAEKRRIELEYSGIGQPNIIAPPIDDIE